MLRMYRPRLVQRLLPCPRFVELSKFKKVGTSLKWGMFIVNFQDLQNLHPGRWTGGTWSHDALLQLIFPDFKWGDFLGSQPFIFRGDPVWKKKRLFEPGQAEKLCGIETLYPPVIPNMAMENPHKKCRKYIFQWSISYCYVRKYQSVLDQNHRYLEDHPS